MFPYLAGSTTPLLLIILIVIWALTLFGGFLYGLRRSAAHTTTTRIPRELRLTSSLCLTILAWVWLQNVRSFQSPELAEAFALWFALGASLNCLGDFIAILVRAAHAQMGSLFAFMTAHVAYISGMVGLVANSVHGVATQADYNPLPLFLMIAAVWLWIMVGMGTWYFWIYRRGDDEALQATPLTYAILVSVTAGMATALTLHGSNFILLAIGAALMWFSELIIAPQFLRQQQAEHTWPLLGDAIWLTYGPGQMLLVLGVAIAILFLPPPFVYGLT
jgi:hypothetical protein